MAGRNSRTEAIRRKRARRPYSAIVLAKRTRDVLTPLTRERGEAQR